MRPFIAILALSVLSMGLFAQDAKVSTIMSYKDSTAGVTFTPEVEYYGSNGLISRLKAYIAAMDAWYPHKDEKKAPGNITAALDRTYDNFFNKMDGIQGVPASAKLNPIVMLLAIAEADILEHQYYYKMFPQDAEAKTDKEKKTKKEPFQRSLEKDIKTIEDDYVSYKDEKMFADKLKVFNYSQRTDPSNIILEAVDRKLKTELDAVKAPKASNL